MCFYFHVHFTRGQSWEAFALRDSRVSWEARKTLSLLF